MPQLAPAVGAAVAFLSSPMGLAIIGGVALAVVGGFVMKSFIPPMDANSTPSGVQTELQIGEETPTSAIYGRSLTAGHYLYHHEYGNDNEVMQMVFALGNGRYDALEKFFVDGVEMPLSGSNSDAIGRAVGGKYTTDVAPYMWVKFYDGSLSQTADVDMIANSGGRWTSNHRLAGIPYAIVTMQYNEEVYGSSLPKFGFQVKGLKLYDWRKDSTSPGGSGLHRWTDQSTWEWSENPAVQLYNYKRGLRQNGVLVLGQGVTPFDLDLNRFTAAANLSDEVVSYPDTAATLKRYTFNASVADNQEAQTVIKSFEAAMGGYGTEIGGAYGPLPGQQQTSVATINDTDLLDDQPVVAEYRMAPSETFTAVSGVYTNPANSWEQVAYGIRYDGTVETAEGGRRLAQLDLPYITSYERANMLAEILRRRDRFQATESLSVGTKFASLEPGDVITRVKPLWGSKTMMVVSREEMEGKTSRLKLREFNNACFPASGESFVPLPPVVGLPVTPPTRLTTVLGLTVQPIPMTAENGDNRAALKVQWDTITDPTVIRVLVKYWPSTETESEAQIVSVEVKTSPTRMILTGLLGLTTYNVKVTIVTDPIRATTYTGVVQATTLAETIDFDVYDIDLTQLNADTLALIGWMNEGLRSVVEQAQALSTQFADEVYSNHKSHDGISAAYKRAITVATGPGSAIVSRLEELEVTVNDSIATAVDLLQTQIDDIDGEITATADALTALTTSVGNFSASGKFRVTTVATQSGAQSTIGLSASATNNGATTSAAMFISAIAGGTSRITMVASQIVLTDGTSSANLPFVFEGGVAKMTAAKIGIITSGRLQSADGKFVIDLDNKRISIST